MSSETEFPAPIRRAGRLFWDRHIIENYKRELLGLDPLARDQKTPIVFVTARQLASEMPYGRRSLGRRIKGRDRGEPKLSAAE